MSVLERWEDMVCFSLCGEVGRGGPGSAGERSRTERASWEGFLVL